MKTDSAYVRAALALQGYDSFDEATIVEIARQFAHIEAIAQPMLALELPEDTEPAPIYRP